MSLAHAQYAPNGKVRILTCVKADGSALNVNGFRWPESGPVGAPDWDPQPICPKDGKGGGLFGWAWGVGIGDGVDSDANIHFADVTRWLVVEADPAEVVPVGSDDC
jgi:hypothetical protein